MSAHRDSPVTELLAAVGRGEDSAQEALWAVVYDELRRVARGQMAGEASDLTLQPTALVHEAYFRLFDSQDVQWSSRRHFFAAAAKAMRRIRIDDARKRKRLKRGGAERPAHLAEEPPLFDQDPVEVLAVDEAVDKLEQLDPRKARVVMLRYFAGLTVDETADALDVSPRTVDNEWRLARAWLHRELSKGDTVMGDK